MTKDKQIQKILEFIERGEQIGKKEYRSGSGTFAIPHISGPLFETWINEIKIFNDRYLKEHPLHSEIDSTISRNNGLLSNHKKIMGQLIALSNDNEFFESKEGASKMQQRKTLEQLLCEDIERCEVYLDNPTDDYGQNLYVEITSRYDGIITNLGNGLYQYYAKEHFYDPEISEDSLVHNIKCILNKLIAYQAQKFPPKTTDVTTENSKKDCNKIFIVHGHDNEAVQEMARSLEKCNFEAIVLREQPDDGLTIIEKIEQYTDVSFAVVLYTQCDIGRAKSMPVEKNKYRARQNVVFEHGYLIGKLGRSRVCALVKGDVETPGDISGVVYVPMDEHGAWKMRLARNMKSAGLNVDMNKFCE